MNQTTRDAILDELKQVFPASPIELDIEAGRYDAWSSYEAREAFERGVAGKTWRELTDDFLKSHADALIFLPADLFAALLPAYLRFIAQDDVFNGVPFAVATLLTRTDDSLFDRNLASLSRAQVGVVARLVQASLDRAPMEEVMQTAYDSYWRQWLSGF